MPLRLAALVLMVFAAAADVQSADMTIPSRKPWTTSRVIGSPDPPPPYRAIDAFPNLRFTKPVHITHAPGNDRLFLCEENGKIFSFPNRPDVKQPDLFFDPAVELKNLQLTPGATGFASTYALAFHPRFTENRLCYVCYILKSKEPNLADGTRISRFRVTDADPPRIDVASETIVLTFLSGGHNGCDLQFGPDGFLYISLGDAEVPSPPDPLRTGQDITDLHSSILRIDVDREGPGLRYAVPNDNPFVGLTINGKPARPEVWAYGFRNPWRMSFDRETGDLWTGDVGWESWESVHKVEKGGNYGWSIVEGRQDVLPDEPLGPTPIRPPVIELPHTQAASVTGGFVYRGAKLPALRGAYIFGDWETRRMWAARADGARLTSLEEIIAPTVRVVGFGEDRAGELYFVDHDTGIVHTLEPNDGGDSAAAAFPRTLSETGLFASVENETPADGVYPFEINAPMWQDYATSRHWIALPRDSSVFDYAEKRPIPGNVPWHNFQLHFPRNAVLVKTFSIEMERGNPATRRRLETQILHFDGSYWHGYTYAWRDDQTDADLVPADGAEKPLLVKDPTYAGGTRRQTWTFQSRSQCLQCHSPWTEYAVAFNLPQLNRTLDASTAGPNQLDRLAALRLLKRIDRNDQSLPPHSGSELASMPRLTNPHDPAAPLEDRAKSYLHVNCSTCHRFGGGGSASIDLSAFDKRREMKELTGPAKLGTFDLPAPQVIAPGEPHRSVLVYRMAKFNGGRMPHIGSDLVDPAGVELIREWVASLEKDATPSTPSTTRWSEPDIREALQSTADALPLAVAVAHDEFPPDLRERVFAAASELPSGPLRDLFDGYLPQDPTKRKLGRTPRARPILALNGDADRGREILLSSRVQCLNCHKLDGKGTEIGPDLSTAGRDRSREELLESLIDPSRRVDPKYQAYVLADTDGRVSTGLLVRRDANAVVLRDAQNKEVSIPAGDVEVFQPSRESLMPTGLLADLTAQEAADLLAYLQQRK
jgi:putative heme-binding domain-containing protein